jgi:hypothetical protein
MNVEIIDKGSDIITSSGNTGKPIFLDDTTPDCKFTMEFRKLF